MVSFGRPDRAILRTGAGAARAIFNGPKGKPGNDGGNGHLKMRKTAICAHVLVIALAIPILCSAKNRKWQEGTVVYAERQSEAPAPSDSVAVTDSGNVVRTVMNRGIEKLIGLPGQRQWAKYWIYVLDTRRFRYVAASKRAITISDEQTVKFAVEGGNLFVLGDDGKEQKLELVKIAQASPQSTTPSTPESSQRSPEDTPPTLRRPIEARNEEPEENTTAPALQNPSLPPAKAELAIESVPDGAAIQLNGKRIGQTPSEISVNPGVATILIERAGYFLWADTVVLQAGESTKVKANLKPLPVNDPPAQTGATGKQPVQPSNTPSPSSGVSAPLKVDSCQPFRAKYDQLQIGDQWTKISQIFGRPTRMEDTARETAYVHEYAGCTLTFRAGSSGTLVAKEANPSLRKESESEARGSNTYLVHAGNGVSAPVVLYKVDPEYSEEAHKAGYSGTVVLTLVVDATGEARDIRVIHSLCVSLDQKAVEAVNKWKFKPGYKDGKPVAVQATIQVNFRL